MMKCLSIFIALIFPLKSVCGQYCNILWTNTAVGVYPSDTIDVSGAYNISFDRQFVLDGDTTLFGFALAIDSFQIYTITGGQAGMVFTCHNSNPRCTAYPDSAQLVRFCLTIANTQLILHSPSWPAFDSILIDGRSFVTVPFLGVQAIPITIPIYYRINEWFCDINAVGEGLARGPLPFPNPASGSVSLDLSGLAGVSRVTVCNVLGETVHAQNLPPGDPGRLMIDMASWPSGPYWVSLQTSDGLLVRKVMKL